MFDDLLKDLPPLTPAEARLKDSFYPFEDDRHFCESLDLLKTIDGRHGEVSERLRSYLRYAKDPTLARDIQKEIDRREAALKKETKIQKAKKKAEKK